MSAARFNWNVFPSTKLEASQMLTPLGCMYTPLSPYSLVALELLRCSLCSSVINQHIRIDRQNNMWWCPFCLKMTFFPETFKLPQRNAEMPEQIRPTSHGTVDYVLPKDIANSGGNSGGNSVYVAAYVIDVYQHTDTIEQGELAKLKSTIAESMKALPDNAVVMLITFSDVVEVHNISDKTTVAFSPELLFAENYDYSKIFKDQQLRLTIIEKLQMSLKSSGNFESSYIHENKYVSANSELLHDYILALKPKLTHLFKPPRATGLATLISTLLLANSHAGLSGKVNLFCSGPPTLNPGKIVELASTIRTHHDVANFNAPFFVAALKFYQTLAHVSAGYSLDDSYTAVYTARGKIVNNSVSENSPRFSFDIYTGSLDQVGVYEMKLLASAGLGNIVLTDGFDLPRFAQHLHQNTMAIRAQKHNVKFSVSTSAGLKVMKAVATGTDLQSTYQLEKHTVLHHEKISDTVTKFDLSMKKRNYTNQWYLGDVGNSDTVAVYFEPETASSSELLDENAGAKEVYIQFETKYTDIGSGKTYLRVSTIKKPTTLKILSENKVKLSNNTWRLLNTRSAILKEKTLLESFDYKAWLVLFTRLLISKIDTTIGYEDFEEVVNDVDSALIRLTKFYGGLNVNTKSSQNPYESIEVIHQISESFKELPALSYSLRRNPQLTRIFNSSPDETAYYHHMFNKGETETSCTMIHPDFYKLSEDGQLKLVSLDITSLDSEKTAFYVLDSVFNVIVFYNYKKTEDKLPLHNSNNDDLIYGHSGIEQLEAALDVVNSSLLKGRSVIPRIILTQSGHSQARFLLARLYPVVDKTEPVEAQSTSWWSFFAGTPAPSNLMTDDLSVNKYYEELLEKVQNYQIHGDF